MLTRNTKGSMINIVRNEKGVLVDAHGFKWSRRGDLDEPGRAAYSAETGSVIQFTKEELVRICKGTRAIQTPITVEELRASTALMEPGAAALAAEKPNQWFREVLIKAEETGQNPSSLAGHMLLDELDRNNAEETPSEPSPLPPVTREEPTRYKRTPRAKLQPGGFEDTFEGKRVLLTPKQVEFMERLDEIKKLKFSESGWYPADMYAECLSDTMSPMAVGAMVTTLREKGVIVTEYSKSGGRKYCQFRLTELGEYIHGKLANGEV